MSEFSISQKYRDILSGFVNSLVQHYQIQKCLLLKGSELDLYNEISASVFQTQKFQVGDDVAKGPWQLILGDLAFGVRDNSVSHKGALGWAGNSLIQSLDELDLDGLAVFLLEPSHLENGAKSLRKHLEKSTANICAVLDTPESMLRPYTALRPLLVIVKKGHVNKEFIAELNSLLQAESVAEAFVSGVSTGSLESGTFVEADQFQGFYRWKIKHQIDQLQSEYKGFKRGLVRDIVHEVRSCRLHESFEDMPDCVYFPKLGTNPITTRLSEITIKHQNVYQLKCNPEIVNVEYLAQFFQSSLGRLIAKSVASHGFIPTVSKSELLDAEIALPPLNVQAEIVESIKKLEFIKSKVSEFEQNLALNPISSQTELLQINAILDAVGELADGDRVKSLIRTGESKRIEFKQTFCLDVQNGTKESRIEDSAIKTVAAFLNSDGGTLLVGVHDSGEITGNEEEIDKFFKSKDKFLLHVKNRIKTRIGEQFYPFINHKLVDVNQKCILVVDCEPSSEEVFVDEKDFYVRTNPATDRLEGRKLTDYIKHRFKH